MIFLHNTWNIVKIWRIFLFSWIKEIEWKCLKERDWWFCQQTIEITNPFLLLNFSGVIFDDTWWFLFLTRYFVDNGPCSRGSRCQKEKEKKIVFANTKTYNGKKSIVNHLKKCWKPKRKNISLQMISGKKIMNSALKDQNESWNVIKCYFKIWQSIGSFHSLSGWLL